MSGRAEVKLTIDNPDAAGAMTVWGFGCTWAAAEPRVERGFTPDLEGRYGWETGAGAEYIERLSAIGPVGAASLTDMTIGTGASQWRVISGLWQQSPTSGTLRQKWLHYYDGRPARLAAGAEGGIRSVGSHAPALQLWAWRMPPGPGETDPALLDIILYNDGGYDDSDAPRYVLRFPAHSAAGGMLEGDESHIHRYPALYAMRPAEGEWTLIDEMRSGGGQSVALRAGQSAVLQVIRVEFDDGWLLVRVDGGEPWAYRAPWQSSVDGREVPLQIGSGRIGIAICGHTALVNCQPLSYAATTIHPAVWLYAPAQCEQTPSYRLVSHEPPGASVTATAMAGLGGRRTYPSVTLTPAAGRRPLLYAVQEYREPTFGEPNSDPWTSEDGDGTCDVLEISGECSDRWRGGRISVELEAAPGEDLREVQVNEALAADVTLDSGTTWTRMFSGFVAGDPAYSREDGSGRERLRLTGLDGIGARLGQKHMWAHCSYEGWPVDEAFTYILMRCGIPESLIEVDAEVCAEEMGARYYLPTASARGGRSLEFGMNDRPEQALDTITMIRDLDWGVDRDGTYFLRPRQIWTPGGTPDWTLDADSVDLSDIPLAPFRAARSFEEFCNVVLVMVGRGWDAHAAMRIDWDSITDATHDYHIGDDWWRIETVPDGDSAELIAERLWARRLELNRLIYWPDEDPTRMPGQYVEVQNAGCDIPDGSVFRVTNQRWRVKGGVENGDYQADLEGVIVEVGR